MNRRPPVRRAAPPPLSAPRLARSRFEDFDVDDSAETQVFQSARRRGGGLRLPPAPASAALRGPARVVALQSGDFEAADATDAPTAEVATAVQPVAPLRQMVPPAMESTPAVALSFDALQPAPMPSALGEAVAVRPRAQQALRWAGVGGLGVLSAAAAALIGFAVWRAPAPEVAPFVSSAAEEASVAEVAVAAPPPASPMDALPIEALALAELEAVPAESSELEAVSVESAAASEVVAAPRAAAPRNPTTSSPPKVASHKPSTSSSSSSSANKPSAPSKPAAASKPAESTRSGEAHVVTAKATARQASRVLDDAL